MLVRRGVYGLPRFAEGGFKKPFARSHADQRVLPLVTEDLSVKADDFISVLSSFLGHGKAFDAICHANITGLSTSTETSSTPRWCQIGHSVTFKIFHQTFKLLNQAGMAGTVLVGSVLKDVSGLMPEREGDPGSKCCDFSVLDFHIHFNNFSHP